MRENLKVRFAPSPTGYLHVGGARTALFNWLYCRKNNGVFLLRIEDTDLQRSTPEMSKVILDAMKWLGLNWDEGPFYQTDRIDIYRDHVEKLIEQGRAYRCFCTGEELDKARAAAEARGEKSWKYDRRCLNLSQEEQERRLKEGHPYAIRCLVPTGKVTYEDLVHGKMEIQNEAIEDFVLFKSDGSPTYHLSVVIDDHLMGITTILRGDDHISNTPKQILLYNAFGWTPPNFGHLPLILGPDHQKLSKRHGVTSVLNYKSLGYLPLALLNFFARLSWNPGDDKPFYSVEELVSRFNLKKISKNNPVFDTKKLDFINSKIISSMEEGELLVCLKELAEEIGGGDCLKSPEAQERIKPAIELLKSRMRNLKEFLDLLDAYVTDRPLEYDAEGARTHFTPSGASLLKAYLEDLKGLGPEEFTATETERLLRSRAEAEGVGAGVMIHAVRLALTGKTVSPGLFDVIVFLGRERAMARIERALLWIHETTGALPGGC